MTDEELRKLFVELRPTKEEIASMAREVCKSMADFLQQEYKKQDGVWWLYSLGKPARPLTDEEISEHILRGDIKND
jgi:hypothetical protein